MSVNTLYTLLAKMEPYIMKKDKHEKQYLEARATGHILVKSLNGHSGNFTVRLWNVMYNQNDE